MYVWACVSSPQAYGPATIPNSRYAARLIPDPSLSRSPDWKKAGSIRKVANGKNTSLRGEHPQSLGLWSLVLYRWDGGGAEPYQQSASCSGKGTIDVYIDRDIPMSQPGTCRSPARCGGRGGE